MTTNKNSARMDARLGHARSVSEIAYAKILAEHNMEDKIILQYQQNGRPGSSSLLSIGIVPTEAEVGLTYQPQGLRQLTEPAQLALAMTRRIDADCRSHAQEVQHIEDQTLENASISLEAETSVAQQIPNKEESLNENK